VTLEVGAPLAVMGKHNEDSPRLRKLTAQTMERVTKGGTVAVAMPKSPFLIELGRLNDEDRQLMVGSRCKPDGAGAEVGGLE
jgi:hypothetical protein